MADESTFKGQLLGISPEKEDLYPNDTSQLTGFELGLNGDIEILYPNDTSQLTGFELGLNGDIEILYPDASNFFGFCLALGEEVPFISHCSRIYNRVTTK